MVRSTVPTFQMHRLVFTIIATDPSNQQPSESEVDLPVVKYLAKCSEECRKLVRDVGFDPTATGLLDACSIQMNC